MNRSAQLPLIVMAVKNILQSCVFLLHNFASGVAFGFVSFILWLGGGQTRPMNGKPNNKRCVVSTTCQDKNQHL
jgi:hypothetical protein